MQSAILSLGRPEKIEYFLEKRLCRPSLQQQGVLDKLVSCLVTSQKVLLILVPHPAWVAIIQPAFLEHSLPGQRSGIPTVM
jgi:hypothetical protein